MDVQLCFKSLDLFQGKKLSIYVWMGTANSRSYNLRTESLSPGAVLCKQVKCTKILEIFFFIYSLSLFIECQQVLTCSPNRSAIHPDTHHVDEVKEHCASQLHDVQPLGGAIGRLVV